jgi:amidase
MSSFHPEFANFKRSIFQSVGLTSRYLVVPISQTQDTIGPMTRTMMDAAYILSVIAGVFVYDIVLFQSEIFKRQGHS